MDGKVGFAYWSVRGARISDCGVNKANLGDHFVVSDGVQPIGGGEVKDLSNPDVFSKLADWCVERGKPRR